MPENDTFAAIQRLRNFKPYRYLTVMRVGLRGRTQLRSLGYGDERHAMPTGLRLSESEWEYIEALLEVGRRLCR